MRKTDITLTENAREKIRELEMQGLYPRLILTKSGCCSYTFDIYPDKLRGSDELTDVEDVHFIVTPQVREFAPTLRVDYGRRGILKNFIVKAK